MADAIAKYGIHVVVGNILNHRQKMLIRSQSGLTATL
jgi:hypothetical protein